VTSSLDIKFEILGIAEMLSRHRLRVPSNQRSYAWERPHVTRLFEDLSTQMNKTEKTYFLGTIVLANDERGLLVADGQQRLATTSILIAAIRDYLYQTGNPADKRTAEKYTHKFLLDYDEEHNEDVPKLRMNADDNPFFIKAVLVPPDDSSKHSARRKTFSHDRLVDARQLAKEHVEHIVGSLPKAERPKWLVQWVKFLEDSVVVIAIKVPKHIDAYKMFETLNDRGLRASQIDILKSFLFAEAKEQEAEVQPRWSSMVSAIETIGDDDLLLSYVRHFWIMRYGPTTEDELAQSFKDHITGRRQAVEIISELEEYAADYVALLTPLDNPRLNGIGKESRAYLAAITALLRIVQIRPLLLAILKRFSRQEARRAFELCLSWSVRFLVAGGGGGGVLDRHYGLRAKEVFAGQITTAKELSDSMVRYIPNDSTFEQAFRIHQVSKLILARYYLHSIENYRRGENKPQIGYFEMPEITVNLEHVMPDKPNDDWDIPPSEMQSNYKRLGNMALLLAKENVRIGDAGFAQKKKVYKESPFLVTQEIAEHKHWNAEEIQKRQEQLALYVPKVWPIS